MYAADKDSTVTWVADPDGYEARRRLQETEEFPQFEATANLEAVN